MNTGAGSGAAENLDDPLARLPESEWAGFLRECDRGRLEGLLKALESRLGTAAERERDLERVRAVAHALNNRLTAERMGRGLFPPA